MMLHVSAKNTILYVFAAQLKAYLIMAVFLTVTIAIFSKVMASRLNNSPLVMIQICDTTFTYTKNLALSFTA